MSMRLFDEIETEIKGCLRISAPIGNVDPLLFGQKDASADCQVDAVDGTEEVDPEGVNLRSIKLGFPDAPSGCVQLSEAPMSGSPLPSPDDVKTPKNYKEHFKARKTVITKFVDPCEDAAGASLECMTRNHYDKDKCRMFFEAYRECKKTWTEQRREDGLKGRDNRIDIKA